MLASSTWAIAAVSLLAIINPSYAQLPTTTSAFFGPCPATVGIKNGGFESGEIAPWTTVPQSSDPTQPAGSIISSGGYQSKHALQVKFPPASSIGWYLGQDMGQQCAGADYAVSFAVNWIGFALRGEPDDHSNFCNIGISPSYCNGPYYNPGYYNASTKAGWVLYNYTCKSRKTAYANLNINLGCLANYTLPAFTLQLDNLSVELVQNQTAPLSSGSTPALTGSPVGSPTGAPTSSPTGISASSNPSGGAPSVSIALTGTAGRTCGSEFSTSFKRFCLLLGPVLYQVLGAGW